MPSRRDRLGCALLAAAVLAGTSCGDDEPADLTFAADGTRGEVPVEAAIAAAVDIGAWGCGPREQIGSGSFIDGDLIITAAHVVAGSDELRVIDAGGRQMSATVVHFDPDLDVALVRTTEVGEPIALRSEEAAAGERGIVALLRRDVDGGALGVDSEIVEVEVLRAARVNTTDIYRDAPVQRAGFELRAEIAPGDSGALAVLPGGGVGLVWSRSNQRDERAWAIDLPATVTDREERATLTDPVDTGPCID